MHITEAHIEDAQALTDLTIRSKSHWGYSPDQIQKWVPDLTLTPEYLQAHQVYKAVVEDKLIGYYSYWETDAITVHLDNLFIDPPFIGHGYGSELMQDFLQRVKLAGYSKVTLDADPHATAFYLKLGFEIVGQEPTSIPGRILPKMEFHLKDQQNPQQSAVEGFNQIADRYEAKFMDFDLYHDTFDRFCAVLPLHAQVLDLACGPGNIARYLLDQRPDLHILGTDLAPNMLTLARKNVPEAEFIQLDIKEVTALDRKFNGVICGFGLPYLSREEAIQFIQDVGQILEPGGVLYLSTMEDDYGKSGWQGPSSGDGPQIYIHYHEAEYLRAALENSGFEAIEVIRKTYPEEMGKAGIDLILLAKKGGTLGDEFEMCAA